MRNAISLDALRAVDLLTPLMAHAEPLRLAGSPAQANLLWTLPENLNRKRVNTQTGKTLVRLPSAR